MINLDIFLFKKYKTLAKKLFSGEHTIRKEINQMVGGKNFDLIKKEVQIIFNNFIEQYDKFMKKLPNDEYLKIFYHFLSTSLMIISIVGLAIEQIYENEKSGKKNREMEIDLQTREKYQKKISNLGKVVFEEFDRNGKNSGKFKLIIKKKCQEIIKINQEIKQMIRQKIKIVEKGSKNEHYELNLQWLNYLINLIDINIQDANKNIKDKALF